VSETERRGLCRDLKELEGQERALTEQEAGLWEGLAQHELQTQAAEEEVRLAGPFPSPQQRPLSEVRSPPLSVLRAAA
jgi:hypothetical protein